MIDVSVIGATGYAGIELVRLLIAHPEVNIVHLISHSHAGKPISHIYPSLKGICEKICTPLDMDAIIEDSDVVFTSLPHGASDDIVQLLHESEVKIIELSGDFRYTDISTYEKWYGRTHKNPDLLDISVYGLPELYRNDIKDASIVANPGCYTTCSILPLAPLVAHRIIDTNSIIIDAKSGATGAGKTPAQELHFCELDENMRAYSVATHRHTSEIEEKLSLIIDEDIKLSFTPHLLPIRRGILCTIYADLDDKYEADYIYNIYNEFYANEPFIDIYNEEIFPEPKFVNGSNHCHIGFVVDNRLNRIISISVLDNLIKGAGGQAIQNMNIMFGLEETTGLDSPAWYL